MILSIETSTDVCSVALSNEGKCLKSEVLRGTASHASNLTPMIMRVMESASLTYADLDAVAVSSGPGSYTGLRIGASTAKGIAYASGKKLIAVPTLSILAHAIFENAPEAQIACPMLDARRMEVYTSLIMRDGQIVSPTQAMIVDETAFGTVLAHSEIVFGGNGADKCRSVITSGNAKFLEGIEPLAFYMGPLAYQRLVSGQTENVAYFEPFYLKDFVATVPKNKVLGV